MAMPNPYDNEANLRGLMNEVAALRAEINRRPVARWAYVTSVSPLRIRYEEDTTPLVGTPSTLLPVHEIGQRVRVLVQLGGVTIVGAAHGDGIAMPAGSMVAFAAETPPAGWVLCNGQLLLRADYPELFATIGTTYGSTDGTNFRVPDVRGRTIVMRNPTDSEFDTLGELFGTKTHTLTAGQMPVHNHNFLYSGSQYGSLPYTIAIPGTGALAFAAGTPASANQISIANAGSGQAHNNIQPSITLNYIIKL